MLTIFSAAALFVLNPTGIEAQDLSTIPRLGVLISQSERPESQAIKGLRDALKELGYKDRKDIGIELRSAKADGAALKPLASELVGQKVRLIFTIGARATEAAKEATSELPIVFIHPTDPVAAGFVKSMTRSGGNMVGVAALAAQMTERRLEIFKQIAPNMRRVLIFYDSNNPLARNNFAQNVTARLGLEVVERPIRSVEELKSSMEGIPKGATDGLFYIPDRLVESQTDFIFEWARQRRVPTMFHEELWAIKGALAAYGPSYYEMGRQAAQLIDKILKGKSPQDLPVERATKFGLVINFRVAKVIGLTIPPTILKKADKVIR